MVVLPRPLAVILRKPCQIRKEAAVAIESGVRQGGGGATLYQTRGQLCYKVCCPLF